MLPSEEMCPISILRLLCLAGTMLPLVAAVSVHTNNHCSNNEDCMTLDAALGFMVSGQLDSNTTLMLDPGVHIIETFYLVQGLSQISIVGDGDPSEVVITCSTQVGMAFIDIAGLSFTNLTISGCGLSNAEHIATVINVTKSFVDVFIVVPPAFSSALFIVSCADLLMENVVIKNNYGFGMTGINVVGTSILSQTHFVSNFPTMCVVDLNDYNSPGGAGGGVFFLYHNYLEHYTPRFTYNFTTLTIQDSSFRNNYACRLNLFTTLYSRLSRSISTDDPTSEHSITGAGGLSIFLAQGDYHVRSFVESCLFRNNSSVYNGAAMEVIQFEITDDCHVFVNNSEFSGNGGGLLQRYGLNGFDPVGALLAAFYLRIPRERLNVEVAAGFLLHSPSTVHAVNCTFTGNVAATGAGLTVVSFGPAIGFVQDQMFVKNCTFRENRAVHGEAISVSEISYSAFEPGVEIYMEDLLVINNTKFETPELRSTVGTGVFDISFLSVFMKGTNTFYGNQNTAMSLYGAIVTIRGNTLFERNVGLTGGAMHFESESYLVLEGRANVTFQDNVGLIAGGAVYVSFLAIRTTSQYDCFLFFDEIDQLCNLFGTCNITNIHASIQFINNSSPLGSAIYGSAFSTCPWGQGSLAYQPELSPENGLGMVAFLNGLEPTLVFDPPITKGNRVINTNAKTIFSEMGLSANTTTVMPGQEFDAGLGSFDQLYQPVPLTIYSQLSKVEGNAVEGAHVVIGETDRYLLVGVTTNFTSVPVTVFGDENSDLNVTITSNEASVEYIVSVYLMNCSIGFQFDNASHSCRCVINETLPEVQCQRNGNITYPVDAWIGVDGAGNFVMHDCITDYCLPGVTSLNLSSPNDQCRNNRGGVLCGGCQDGYSRVLGTSRCMVCPNHNHLALIIVFAVWGILLVLTISFLGMTITDGYINGFIFYCNIISIFLNDFLAISHEQGGSIVTPLVAFLNLDFGIETCFFNGMTQLDTVALNLIFPFYLAGILLVIVLLAKYCRRPNLFKDFNATHSLATLLLLSYTSIVRTCIDIVGVYSMDSPLGTRWHGDPNLIYFSSYHGFLCILSIVLLIVLVPFPLLLVAPRLTFRIKTLCKLKPLIDAFVAPFDSHRRSWLGFRLLVRLVIFIIAFLGIDYKLISVTILLALLVVLQAYLKPFSTTIRNLVDLSIVLNLTILSIVGLYLRPKNLQFDVEVHYVTLGFVLVFGLEFIFLFVYYILKAFAVTRKFCWKIKSLAEGMLNRVKAFVVEHSKSTKKSVPMEAEMFHRTHHTSVAAPGNDQSFQATEFIGLRESLLEANS